MNALRDEFAGGTVIPEHCHARAQIVYALRGTMRATAGDIVWTLPPSHALWIPSGITHEVRMLGPVDMTSLYIDADHSPRQEQCEVFFVSPLLRELIARAMDLPPLYDAAGMDGRLMQLILDEIALLPAKPLGLRMPDDPRLARLCRQLLDDVASHSRVSEAARKVGLSERTLHRLFPRETGLSFHRWYAQAKLHRAFELAHGGMSITEIAYELGYSGPTPFAKMVRSLVGKTPSELLFRQG